jgi:ribosomal protein S27AE
MSEDTSGSQQSLICGKCGAALVPVKAQFGYLGHTFHTEVPGCPECGWVFISEELAGGRMMEVETLLEDK